MRKSVAVTDLRVNLGTELLHVPLIHSWLLRRVHSMYRKAALQVDEKAYLTSTMGGLWTPRK